MNGFEKLQQLVMELTPKGAEIFVMYNDKGVVLIECKSYGETSANAILQSRLSAVTAADVAYWIEALMDKNKIKRATLEEYADDDLCEFVLSPP